ncbi:MAG: regulatory iron-sulfur-containing complex subunit RicT [Saprospiraceae bacterium]
MACAGCTSCGTSDSGAKGCKNNGCSTGGCNRLNTYDWLSVLDIEDATPFDLIEVSFKNGARKEFYHNPLYTGAHPGDYVVLDTGAGFDIGKVSLTGELVRLQMKKKRVPEDGVFNKAIRKANERDLERLEESRGKEKHTMIRARAIARSLDLDMKIGDVEFQADGKKATFYYTADGRVDFRELIKHFAREFKVKIEMRQIGTRQESARIGGLGSCGRELCCSTWLTDFKSVTTTAARYQNLAINQAKLSGQCGRLKCCLNYELDTYMEAFDKFPKHADRIKTRTGIATLIKTDIFKQLMYYVVDDEASRGKTFAVEPQKIQMIIDLNKKGETPPSLAELQVYTVVPEGEEEHDYEDVTGVVELPMEKRKKKKRKKKGKPGGPNRPPNPKGNSEGNQQGEKKGPRDNRNNPRKGGPNDNKDFKARDNRNSNNKDSGNKDSNNNGGNNGGGNQPKNQGKGNNPRRKPNRNNRNKGGGDKNQGNNNPPDKS